MANNQLKEEIILSTGQFDKNIDSVIKKVEELKRKNEGFNSSFGKMITKATGFNGSMDSLVKMAGKFGGAMGAITSGVKLAEWFKSSVAEGVRLADEAEGIRLAFERLNRGDLLDNLRRETHGTVTDVELMKQAVKFDDFKLNIDQMGTLLAFAQQKAKDTGQSIDYMVDSIVTGLGRKSLPILDNLGLSAAEIKEKMKEGGDMTTAVAKIIEEKMKQSGDYVETAADRAKKREVELQNALEELGRTFGPLTETSDSFWHSIEIGAIKAVNSIKPLINQFTELGRIMNAYEKMGGDNKVNRMVGNLGDGKSKGSKNIYDRQIKEFERYINERKQYLKDYHDWEKKRSIAAYDRMAAFQKKTGLTMFSDVKEQMIAAQRQMDAYKRGANAVFNKTATSTTTDSGSTKTKKTKTHVAVYKAEARTVQEITDNIEVLTKKLKTCVPNTEEYRKVSKEIEQWKLRLDTVDIDKTAKTTKEISSNISILQKKLENIDPSTDEFITVTKELMKWQQKLEDVSEVASNLKFNQGATTIKDINTNISILQSRLDKTVKGSNEWLEITRQIKEETKKLANYQKGSLADLQEQISEIETRLSNENLDLKTRLKLIDKKNEIQSQIDNLSDDSYIKVKPIAGETRRKMNSVSNAQTNISNVTDQYESGIISFKQAKKEIAEINQKLIGIKAKPIVVNLETNAEKVINNIQTGYEGLTSAFYGIDSVVGSFESLTSSIENSANAWEVFMGVLNVGMSIIQGISGIIQTVTFLQNLFTASNTASAIAVEAASTAEKDKAATDVAATTTATAKVVALKAEEAAFLDMAAAAFFAAHAYIPFAGAGIATGFITEMLATMATTKAATASLAAFANGGIVGGSSFAGDNLIARVNSGEMILNGSQQKNLFDLLDKGGSAESAGGNVEFKIKGSDLYGALKNYSNIKSKSGRITGIR